MIVRYLVVSDRAEWQPLWDGYLEFYEEQLAPEITDDTFARLCDQRDGFAAHVAVDDTGKLVGFAHTLTHPSTWTSDRYVYIEDLFVAPDVRRGGVGRALFAAVYERAGGRHVYWHTQETNTVGRALYDKIGKNSGFIVYER
ncbi:MAG: hypothetical protein QOF76_1119 [Solirubrobacteraceae bacterium]|jgi:GNAT superfamily N-acetyltransferase|nr:hypothetical protein [Solirubrobacteraceae bacterium]